MKKFQLSDIELYYTLPEFITKDKITLADDEFKHCCKVMRNVIGDVIYITDGEGNIYKSEIEKIKKNSLSGKILETISYKNGLKNIFFCIPKLKSPDRLKYALEKCVELGITNFILFESKRTIGRIKNIERFNRILISAMKQSLHAFLPVVCTASLKSIITNSGIKILFDQGSENQFSFNNNSAEKYYFLFGPEGGFEDGEIGTIDSSNKFFLSNHRLRSETAVIKCASLLTRGF
ncbi:MAG: 16S rRNA (uracil(1498)-N(3))-methyltransferase [Ignavibacteriaceae bacterium]|nr:16S rRNA (uracil(1498)-N(3))-methyltransferase [Ignavibacteriaceae bacterium]